MITGPPETPYEGFRFELQIDVGDTYPMVPPAIMFKTKIFHPNVHFHASGTIKTFVNKFDFNALTNVEWGDLLGYSEGGMDASLEYQFCVPSDHCASGRSGRRQPLELRRREYDQSGRHKSFQVRQELIKSI